MDSKKLTLSGMFVALGVLLGNILYIPVGVAKCFFIQHTINILGAVILGPFYSLTIAFSISLLRNILGTGSILAFPGSMIGAFLAGLFFHYGKSLRLALLGEILGTGILGGLVSYYIVTLFMGKEVGLLFFIAPFLLSSMLGSFFAYFLIKYINFNRILKENKE